MRTFALVVALAALGCGRIPVGTDLNVRYLTSDGQLATCNVHFNWTVEDAIAACGEPKRRVERRGGGSCLIYENLSMSLRVESTPAHFMALCFEPMEATMARDRAGKLQPLPAALRLSEVFGLRRID
jgi:hypothetical protein